MPDPSIFTSVINSYLPEPQASLLNGMLFGTDLNTSTRFYDQLKQVGLLHLVVLSGMNITLLGATIGAILTFVSKKVSTLITIISIIIFILFVGAEAPIIRAGIIGVLTLVAILYGFRASALYLLLIAIATMAVVWPEWIGSISFQLSVGATLGIILFGPKLEKKNRGRAEEVKSSAGREFHTALAAMIFTAPLIFFYFGQVSVIAPLSNVLVAPLVAPIMVFGFVFSFSLLIGPVFALVPGLIVYAMLTYVVLVVEILASIPFSYFQIQ